MGPAIEDDYDDTTNKAVAQILAHKSLDIL